MRFHFVLQLVKIETEEEIVDVIIDGSDSKKSNQTTKSSKKNSKVKNRKMDRNDVYSNSENSVTSVKKIDEIDLTISDSDDEPLIWYKNKQSKHSYGWYKTEKL